MRHKPSNNQTKEWRKSQPWYLNGKLNDCGKYQKGLIEGITKASVNIAYRVRGLERFNTYQEINGKIIYCHCKMICGSGGSQTEQ